MERIPYPAPESYPPELPLANMLRMWAHSPATFRPAMALGTACVNSLSISADLGEILALYCAVKFQCQYIWARHANDARSKGVTEIQLQALQSGDLRNLSSWDKKQVAFLAFLDEVIDLPQAKEETFQEARKWFDEKQIIEIITAQVCNCSFSGPYP